MNVLLVALHPTVALLNVTCALLNVISPLFNASVLTHTLSVHVNTILHVAPLFKSVLLGVHHVHTGAVVSVHAHVNVVFADIVVLADGAKVPFHLGVEYHEAVLHVIVQSFTLQLVACAAPLYVDGIVHEPEPLTIAVVDNASLPYVAVYVIGSFDVCA